MPRVSLTGVLDAPSALPFYVLLFAREGPVPRVSLTGVLDVLSTFSPLHDYYLLGSLRTKATFHRQSPSFSTSRSVGETATRYYALSSRPSYHLVVSGVERVSRAL